MPGTPTPNMGLTQPTVGGDIDIWGNEINGNNSIVDSHTHQLGSGIPITPLGLNINSDLSLQGNNLNVARSVRLINNGTTLAGAGDVGNVYQSGGNLYYNNSAGVPVQITNGTVVNSSATAATIFPQTSASSNFTILASATYIEVLVQTTSVSCTITLPAASAVARGRYFIIKDVTGNAATNNITIAAAGADTIDGASTNVFNLSFQSCFIVSDASSNWSVVGQQKNVYLSGENVTFNSGSAVTFNRGSILSAEGTTNLYNDINYGDGSVSTYSGGAIITGDILDTATTLLTGGGTLTTSSFLSGDGYIYAGVPGSILSQTTAGIISGQNYGICLSGGSADWIGFTNAAGSAFAARTRTIQSAIVPVSLPNTGADASWSLSSYDAGFLNSTMGAVWQTGVTYAGNENIVFNLPMHNGATLSSVTISFIVNSRGGNAPQNFPKIAIARNTFPNGAPVNTVSYLSSTSFQPLSTAANGTIWSDGENIQQYTYTCNQNNIIDTSTYTYAGVLYGEYGTYAIAGDAFYNITVVYTNIIDMRFP